MATTSPKAKTKTQAPSKPFNAMVDQAMKTLKNGTGKLSKSQLIPKECDALMTELRTVKSMKTETIKDLLWSLYADDPQNFYRRPPPHLYLALRETVQAKTHSLVKTLIERREPLPSMKGNGLLFQIAKQYPSAFLELMDHKLVKLDTWIDVYATAQRARGHYSDMIHPRSFRSEFTENLPKSLSSQFLKSVYLVTLDFLAPHCHTAAKSSFKLLSRMINANPEMRPQVEGAITEALKTLSTFDLKKIDFSKNSEFHTQAVEMISLLTDSTFAEAAITDWMNEYQSHSKQSQHDSSILFSLFSMMLMAPVESFKSLFTHFKQQHPDALQARFSQSFIPSEAQDIYPDHGLQAVDEHGLLSFAMTQKKYEVAEYLLDQGIRPLCTLHTNVPQGILAPPGYHLIRLLLSNVIAENKKKNPNLPASTLFDKLQQAIVQEGISHHGQTEDHMNALIDQSLNQYGDRLKSSKSKSSAEQFILQQMLHMTLKNNASENPSSTHSSSVLPKKTARRL